MCQDHEYKKDDDLLMHEFTRVGIELTDGRNFSIKGRKPKVYSTNNPSSSPCSISMKFSGTDKEPEFVWQGDKLNETTYSVQLHIKNTTSKSLPVEKMIVYTSGLEGDIKASMTGYETESPAHPPLPLSQHERLLSIAEKSPPRVGPVILSENDTMDPLPWMTQMIDGKGGRSLIGFTTAKEQAGYIAIKNYGEISEATAFTVAEGVKLDPGDTMSSEKLLVSFERDPRRAVELYARTVATEMDAKVLHKQMTSRKSMKGWGSWYESQWDVNEEEIKKNVDALEHLQDKFGVEYIVTDDQFDPKGNIRIGDWFAESQKFPSGYKKMNEYIHAKSMKSVLWLAPLIASSESEVYKAHPDWFVKGKEGKSVNAMTHWGTENYALDTTHPEAQEHLRNMMRETIEQGFEGVKLDFLYMNNVRGERYDKKATSISALRKGLQIMDEEMDDKFVLHCGAPIIPAVGYANLSRIGPDAAPFWIDPSKEGTASSIKYANRSVWAREWMDGELYKNDPDVIIARENNSQLTDAERETWLTTVALNGVIFLGDDVSKLDEKQIKKMAKIFPPSGTGEKAIPIEFDENGMATKVQMEIERDGKKWQIAAMFNMKDEESDLVFHPEEWGLEKGKKYHLFDQWEEKYVGSTSTSLSEQLAFPSVPAHGVKVLAVYEDTGELPTQTTHLLGI